MEIIKEAIDYGVQTFNCKSCCTMWKATSKEYKRFKGGQWINKGSKHIDVGCWRVKCKCPHCEEMVNNIVGYTGKIEEYYS